MGKKYADNLCLVAAQNPMKQICRLFKLTQTRCIASNLRSCSRPYPSCHHPLKNQLVTAYSVIRPTLGELEAARLQVAQQNIVFGHFKREATHPINNVVPYAHTTARFVLKQGTNGCHRLQFEGVFEDIQSDDRIPNTVGVDWLHRAGQLIVEMFKQPPDTRPPTLVVINCNVELPPHRNPLQGMFDAKP